MMRMICAIGLSLGFALLAFAAPPPASLIPNPGMETDANNDQWPDGWPKGAGVTWEKEGENHFLRLAAGGTDKTVMVYLAVPIKPEHKALDLSYRVRYADVKPGKEAWHDARFILHFKDAAGKQLKPTPRHPNFRGSSKGWAAQSQRLVVPAEAKLLEVMPAMMQAAGGTLDIDDLKLVAVAPDAPLPKAGAEAAAPAVAVAPLAINRAAIKSPQLRVAGNQLQTVEGGKQVWLQGVNVPSLEWSVGGERVLQSVLVVLDDWKANVIRLPVSDDHWFGKGKGQSDGGAAYRALVDQVVQATGERGGYVVLDLHRYRAPREEHLAFWKDAATRYQDHPAVLFDLLNEPHDLTWDVWRNGGPVTEKPKGAAEPVTFTSPGMQKMVEAVRATGARNVLVAGALDWAYDLSGIVNGYALEDKTGHGIVYSTHIYSWKRDWQEKVLATAAKHPILVGEAGGEPKPMPFIPAAQHEDPYTWAPDFLGMVQKHKLHYTAWCIHPKATPRLISDWEYTPTPFWGAFVKAALKGARFEMTKLR